MPPKLRATRASKASKASKENEYGVKISKINGASEGVKSSRRALADKTNSASDDNTSILTYQNLPEKLIFEKKSQKNSEQNDLRPRRTRKLPNRYKENIILANLSNSKESIFSSEESKTKTTPVRAKTCPLEKKSFKDNSPVKKISPLKSPVGVLDGSLIHNRPKRIGKLPSKFDNHCVSPSKSIPVQPINTSTPLVNKTKLVNKRNEYKSTKTVLQKKAQPSKTVSKKNTIKNYFNDKTSADSNNNAKKVLKSKISPKKAPVNTSKVNTSIYNDISEKKNTSKRDSSKLDIYEFTYDPEEEPPPAKKKKKRTVTKKPSKPKTITVRSNYDKNLAKALAALKKEMLEKSPKYVNMKDKTNLKDNCENYVNVVPTNQTPDVNEDVCVHIQKNYNSVRVEDIAKDMQGNDDIDYSPVNSPSHSKVETDNYPSETPNDPLNLQDMSFFDEQPVASSSMNTSNHPLASPWRVEFESLPIKWPVNTYVKPNMTPAFECSFINFNDSKKKHVYTNMVQEANDSFPQIVDSPNLKQTSIMSFLKEVVEKSANKRKKSTPVKANSLFEDTNVSVVENQTPYKQSKNIVNITPNKNSSTGSVASNEKENLNSPEIDDNMTNSKVQNNRSDEKTYFGFDNSEDQENVSPKKNNKARLLRSRSRGILQELNVQKGPMRAVIPVSVKSKPVQSEVNKLFDDMKSAMEPPILQVPDVGDTEVTVTESILPQSLDDNNSQSVRLFEDIEPVHHHKPSRKSYGKPKKVAFSKNSLDSDSSPLSDLDHASCDEDSEDSSFKLPSIKPKKAVKKKKINNKQKLSKREEKEVEVWAAGFNSMCEDIDEFDLVVE